MKPSLTIRDPQGTGYHTWRLALAFFVGLCGAWMIVDYLAVTSAQLGFPDKPRRLVLAWPVTHLVVLTILAYSPVLLRACRLLLGRLSRRHFYSGLGVVSLILYSSSVWVARSELSKVDLRPQWKYVLEQIDRGGLVPDNGGLVHLPEQVSRTTADGSAYVTRTGAGKTWVLFCIWHGKGSNLIGYLYTSGDTLSVPSEVSVNTNDAGVIAPAVVTTERDLGDGWYRVFRSIE